jgi:hypothetical protein
MALGVPEPKSPVKGGEKIKGGKNNEKKKSKCC